MCAGFYPAFCFALPEILMQVPLIFTEACIWTLMVYFMVREEERPTHPSGRTAPLQWRDLQESLPARAALPENRSGDCQAARCLSPGRAPAPDLGHPQA